MVDHDWIFTIFRCFHQCIVQVFNSTFMNVIVVFKAQATAEVFDMFWIDNFDMSLVAETFYNLLQAAIIVITLVRFECTVCTCTEVYNLFKVSWFDTVFQFVAISFRSCFRNIWCNTCLLYTSFTDCPEEGQTWSEFIYVKACIYTGTDVFKTIGQCVT